MKTTIKYYGIFNMTKKQYIYAQSAAFICLIILWIITPFADFIFLGSSSETFRIFFIILLGITTIAEGVETIVMLKKFSKATHTKGATS